MDCSELVSGLNDLAEASYIIEKLYNMTLHHSCLAAQKEMSVKELEAKNQQVSSFFIYKHFRSYK